MTRNTIFTALLALMAAAFCSSCEKETVETPRLESHFMNFDFSESPDGALAVSLAKELDKATPKLMRDAASTSEDIDLVVFQSPDGSFHLASPSSEILDEPFPIVKEWATRKTTRIRKTTLTPDEASEVREGEAGKHFEQGTEQGRGAWSGPVKAGEVFALQLDSGEVVLASTTICIGVQTASGNCIGIYIHKKKDKE